MIAASVIECLNASMYEVKFGTDKGKQLHLDKANRDIAMLVNLCRDVYKRQLLLSGSF